MIRYELGLCLGETRVDVAVINGAISGWEIKSAQDRLDRLPRQVLLYSRVLDLAVVVAAGKHASHAEGIVPAWWGIVRVDASEDGQPVLKVSREPKQNENVDAFALAQLLWRDEAYDVLRHHCLHGGLAKATRWKLWRRLADELPTPLLKSEVRDRLRARQAW